MDVELGQKVNCCYILYSGKMSEYDCQIHQQEFQLRKFRKIRFNGAEKLYLAFILKL